MTSILAKSSEGPNSYEAAQALDGAQVVETRAGGVDLGAVGLAADNSVKVVGITQKPAMPNGGAPREPQAGVLDMTLAPAEVAVYDGNQTVPGVLYSTAAAYGDRLVSAGDGAVEPATAESDPRAIFAWCKEPEGVAAGARGRVKLTL